MIEDFLYDGMLMSAFMSGLVDKFIIASTTGRGVMSLDNVTNRIAGGHGSRFVQNTFPPRSIGVNFIIRLKSVNDLRHMENEITKVLAKSEPKELVFTDQQGAYSAVFDGMSLSRDDGLFQVGTINFLCPNPFRLIGQVSLSAVISANGSFNVTNNGNWYAEPVFIINTAEPTGLVTLTVNDKPLAYVPQSTIPSGTTISVDADKKEFRVNNSLKVLDVAGAFPVLQPGANVVRADVGCNIAATFPERNI